MRPAAEILLAEAAALPPILDAMGPDDFDLPTVCTGWSVRDVLAHCSAALTRTASGDLHHFTPEDNQRDVDERKPWSIDDVIAELLRGYEQAAVAIDAAGGRLDGVGLGEWMHGGDVRDALGRDDAYTSAGADLAVVLLMHRSLRLGRLAIHVHLGDVDLRLGAGSDEPGQLATDLETFIRLCGGRRPDPARYTLSGATAGDLVLFD
jgi:uncharacterized protein (TIGR03083 family)